MRRLVAVPQDPRDRRSEGSGVRLPNLGRRLTPPLGERRPSRTGWSGRFPGGPPLRAA
ncbi:hypothetical protein GCM10009840_10450 [Pseudolysinimonas kribbensis]|uniref:Uncharacterized protein n=1 Tax=Pseudolysinimonas kribbensis TaxID=433641 RepID=A0ABQ6K679_9MICO|nr:hypothetical protein [Pseudolysinimonas kribbensis]GMA95467.1 hypothetical protein GCM10025881_22910 [Pseudolysinimonas kribbensis]